MASRKLTLADIADLREYERTREAFRARVIEMKKHRRVHVGPIVTLVFENRDTVRFQIQEMARAERMLSDEQIQEELDVYNPLIPEPGCLSATLFIELTTQEELRAWLPRLVGIERSVALELAGGEVVRAEPEAAHASQLTRQDVTASVHYVQFRLTPAQVEALASGEASLVVDHPEYRHRSPLAPATRQALLEDLRGD
jgi:hypothetical protein